MIKNTLIISALATTSLCANAQINLDSLKAELEKTHIQVKSSNDWNAYTIKYLDKDSLVRHVIPYDKDGEIEESIWGIALSSYNYDSQGREIERRYYDSKGNLHFSDWPPIIKLDYNKQGLLWRKAYYGEDEKILEGLAIIEFQYDKDGDIIEDKTLNGNLESTRITRFEYNKEKNVVIETNYDENTKFISRQKLLYKTRDREIILEVHNLDQSDNYMEVKHATSNKYYSVMKYSYDFKPNWVKIELLDKDLNKVHEYSQYVSSKKK